MKKRKTRLRGTKTVGKFEQKKLLERIKLILEDPKLVLPKTNKKDAGGKIYQKVYEDMKLAKEQFQNPPSFFSRALEDSLEDDADHRLGHIHGVDLHLTSKNAKRQVLGGADYDRRADFRVGNVNPSGIGRQVGEVHCLLDNPVGQFANGRGGTTLRGTALLEIELQGLRVLHG